MNNLDIFSRISLYVLLTLIGVFALILFVWQVMVLKGKTMKVTDGSVNDWHVQKVDFGGAFADVFLASPASIAGIVLVFISPRWGFYLLAMVSFWFVWANTMTTATSLRFQKPRITWKWFITFPFGVLVGLAFIIWTIFHFDAIYFP